MKEKIADINPKCKFHLETFVLPDNLEELGADRPRDYILDAIDTVTAKLAPRQVYA